MGTDGFMSRRRCAVCKKVFQFETYHGWGYMYGPYYCCSYACMRARERAAEHVQPVRQEKPVSNNKRTRDTGATIAYVNQMDMTSTEKLEQLVQIFGQEWMDREMHAYNRHLENENDDTIMAVLTPKSKRTPDQRAIVKRYRNISAYYAAKMKRREQECMTTG